MDAYYVRIIRSSLSKVEDNLQNTQNYMAEATELEAEYDEVERIIKRIRKMSDRLGNYLIDGVATEK